MKRLLTNLVLFVAVALSSATWLPAYDMGSANLLIPIAGRVPGAFGTQWRTDLVVTNLESDRVSLFVTYYAGPEGGAFTNVTIEGNGTLVLEDVLRTLLDVHSGSGMLRISSASPGARFVARAYIYNQGSLAGEYGQGVPAIPVDALRQDHTLAGVTAMGGRRTNVGIANPWSNETDVILVILDGAGEPLGFHAVTVASTSVIQMNDIFATFGAPLRGDASIRLFSSLPVYPYASIVRNDTGDAVFHAGSGFAPLPEVLTPGCSEPAPIIHPVRGEAAADETIVEFRAGTPRSAIEQLAVRHGFTIGEFHEGGPAITALLTPSQIAGVRCDPSVQVVRRDGARSESLSLLR